MSCRRRHSITTTTTFIIIIKECQPSTRRPTSTPRP
jgi:hypothetical protein